MPLKMNGFEKNVGLNSHELEEREVFDLHGKEQYFCFLRYLKQATFSKKSLWSYYSRGFILI